MPQFPSQRLPRISAISPIGGERSNAAARTAVCRRASVTRAPRSRARLIPVTTRRRLMAKPCTPHLHCAARAALQAANCQCKFSLGGSKGGISLFRKEISLPCPYSASRRCPPPAPLRGEQTKRKPSRTSFSQVCSLYSNRLRKISGLINIAPALERDIVCQ